MTDLLRLDDLMRRLDYPLPSRDPRTWTAGGQPLAGDDLEVAAGATAEDWQALHDLTCLDGAACGRGQAGL